MRFSAALRSANAIADASGYGGWINAAKRHDMAVQITNDQEDAIPDKDDPPE